MASNREPWFDPKAVRRTKRLVEFDDLVVAPRFGFEDAADYYAKCTMGPKLDRVTVPTVFLAARRDPMIPFATLEPWLDSRSDRVRLEIVERGGHVGFPRRFVTSDDRIGGLEDHVCDWLE